ncbi:MAG: universal stress protein, partial [Microthrixaceae bacterium]
ILSGAEEYAPPEVMDARVEQSLRDWLGSMSGGAVEAEVAALRGPGAHALVTAATSPPADLLVVGTRGLGAIDQRLLGSISRRLTEQAPCPVVVVPEGADEGTGPIVIGLDGTPDSNAAFDLAAELAERSATELVVVNCVEPIGSGVPGNALDQARELGEQLLRARAAELDRRGIAHRSILSFEPARVVLEATAREESARLLLVGARGAGGMEKLLLGSVSSYLSAYADRAVAVVHRQQA